MKIPQFKGWQNAGFIAFTIAGYTLQAWANNHLNTKEDIQSLILAKGEVIGGLLMGFLGMKSSWSQNTMTASVSVDVPDAAPVVDLTKPPA